MVAGEPADESTSTTETGHLTKHSASPRAERKLVDKFASCITGHSIGKFTTKSFDSINIVG
jgi:hypothetical protein